VDTVDHHRDRFAGDVRLDRFVDGGADQNLGEMCVSTTSGTYLAMLTPARSRASAPPPQHS
jgi:hypothetical protein